MDASEEEEDMDNCPDSDFRCEEFLRVKIGEAKNLQPRGGSGSRDVFCTVNLDREEIFRTSIVGKTLSPFFAEEFHFEIPRRFRNLAFYVYDHDSSRDKVLGKVALKREDLHVYHGKDHWLPIKAVDEDSEVEGKVHVGVKIDHVLSSRTGQTVEKLAVRIIECSELAVISGSCHSFVLVSLLHGNERLETKRTKTKRRTTSPLFDETFHFSFSKSTSRGSLDLNEPNLSGCVIKVTVFHESAGGFASTFLGEVSIPLDTVDLQHGYKFWHMLQPRSTTETAMLNQQEPPKLGSLRIKIHYTSDYVLSSRYYTPLKECFITSPSVMPITSSAAFILGEIASNKTDAAQPLVKLFLSANRVLPLVRGLAEWEIRNVTNPSIIFRGNTLLSKFLDELMKLIGMHYLHETLRGVITRVIREKKPCEIDPTRLKEGQSLEENMANLKMYLDLIFKSIITSVIMCPKLMREVFSILKDLSLRYFPCQKEVAYSVISGFIFLRFFAPAILNPKLFDITSETIDPVTGRTLTLMSKSVQMMGNLVSSKFQGFSLDSNPPLFKEDFMAHLQKCFVTDQHIDNTKVFLELISSPNNIPRANDKPMVLKEGLLLKRLTSGKTSPLSRPLKKFRSRFFTLTTHDFFYSRNKNKPSTWTLPVHDILAVEKLAEECFRRKHMFQILSKDRPALYVKAHNCVEQKEWIDILAKVCHMNRNRLSHYHPSTFSGQEWRCCQQSTPNALGCCPVSKSNLPTDFIHIDPDREVARIHSLLMSRSQTMDDLLTKDANGIDEHDTRLKTLTQLKELMTQLEGNRQMFSAKEVEETVYGSEKAPFGDTRYLSLLAKQQSQSSIRSPVNRGSL